MVVVSIDGDAFAGRTSVSRGLSVALKAKYLDIKILSEFALRKGINGIKLFEQFEKSYPLINRMIDFIWRSFTYYSTYPLFYDEFGSFQSNYPSIKNSKIDNYDLFYLKEKFSTLILESLASKYTIINGCMAQNLLNAYPDLYKVFITAPFEFRVMRAAVTRKLSHEEAENVVKEIDKNRNLFANQVYSFNRIDLSYYDLVIDISEYNKENSIKKIIENITNLSEEELLIN